MSRNTSTPVASNPRVFVVGCPRSGTTLLQRMLDAHEDLAIANDTHFIPRAAKKLLRQEPDPPLTPELVEAVMNYRRFYRMGLISEEVHAAARHSSRYSEFVGRLYDRRAEKAGKTHSGEKTPDYCRQIPILSKLFPKAKFLHIIRDGRDTALSTLDWATENKGPGKWGLWQTDPLGTCALWWRWQVGTGIRDGRKLDENRYLEVFYEKLVADSQTELRKISDFLELPYSDNMGQFFRGKTRDKPGLSAKSAWIPPTSGLRDWKTQMSSEDALVFQELAGDLLESLDYALIDNPNEAPSERARTCRDWWASRHTAG